MMSSKMHGRLKWLLTTYFFFLASFAATAFAGGNSVDNGGEMLALEFTRLGVIVHETLLARGSNEVLDQATVDDLGEAIAQTRVHVAEGSIFDVHGLAVDARVVDNDKGGKTIEIDRTRWARLVEDKPKVYGLVLHEYLRVLGKNDNNYVVSSKIRAFDQQLLSADAKTPKGKVVLEKPSSPFVWQGSTGQLRSEHRWLVGAGIAHDLGLWASHVKVGIILDEDWEVDLVASSNMPGMLSFNPSSRQSIDAKYYVSGSSFFVSLGVARQVMRGPYQSLKSDDQIWKSETAGTTIAVGNQWLLPSGFLFGVDWFGAYKPIKTLETTRPAQDYERPFALRGTIGWAF